MVYQLSRAQQGRASLEHLVSTLNSFGRTFIVGTMKRIALLLAVLALSVSPLVRGQDAATEERLNKLAGQIEDLRAGQDSLHKQVEALLKELDTLRDQAGKPTGNYAAQEDLKRVADAVKEVDQKRIDDAEKIRIELLNLRKGLLNSTAPPKKLASVTPTDVAPPDKPEKGFEYTIQKGDTLSTIVQAYRDKNIKISTEQILKANPELKPERLRVGQKIFIPAPKV